MYLVRFLISLFLVILPTLNANFVIAADTTPASAFSVWPQFDQGKTDEALNILSPISKLPDDKFYFLIVIKENTTRFFTPTPIDRSLFDIKLSGKRLKESYLLVKNGNSTLGLSNLEKYNYKVDNIFEQLEKIEKQNLSSQKTIEELTASLFYQQRIFAVISWELKNEDNGVFKKSVDNYERLINKAIEKSPSRIHELKPLLSPNSQN